MKISKEEQAEREKRRKVYENQQKAARDQRRRVQWQAFKDKPLLEKIAYIGLRIIGILLGLILLAALLGFNFQ